MPAKAARAASPKYQGIQVLRGLAAGLVVLHHVTQAWSGYPINASSTPWANGAAGVDIFFVISGFVMFGSIGERPSAPHPARTFLERRLIRLVPLYWVVTLLYAFNLLRAAHQNPALAGFPLFANLTPLHLAFSLCFIPFHNAFGLVQPVLAVGWTLCFEMFFYLLLTCAIAFRIKAIPFLTLIMVVLAAIGCLRQDSWPAVTSLASPLLLEFLAGLFLGRAAADYHAGWRIPASIATIALATLLFVPLSVNSALRVPLWGTEATLIVWAAVSLEPVLHSWWPRWATLSGEASYALYLIHLPLVTLLVKRLVALHFHEPISILLCLILSFALAIPIHLFLEKPMTELLKKTLLSRRPTRASTAPSITCATS